jgi:hypothetical protein
LVARGEVCRVWTAEPERNAEALRITNRNISAKFSGRFQQCQRENIGCNRHQCAGVMRLLNEI